jgi:glycine/betaine/sarcosine/D-proline reductase family selenoprotein B
LANKLRVVHYINQFFAQYGGEDMAGMGIEVREEAVGPGKILATSLGDNFDIVATIICGDNYIAERLEEVTEQVVAEIRRFEPDLVVAGPAFNAGRYGVACGSVCVASQNTLGVPVITAMYKENPGVELYKRDLFIVSTGTNAKTMASVMMNIAKLATKLVNNEEIGTPTAEGYIERKIMRCVRAKHNGARRLVDMALDRFHGRPFHTEIPVTKDLNLPFAKPLTDLSKAVIAVVSDGGLYPVGNPDRMPPLNADRFVSYCIEGQEDLRGGDWMVNHPGYDSKYVVEDPDRLIPLDAMRVLEKEGFIYKLHENFLSTTGLATSNANSKKIGRAMIEYLKNTDVNAIVLTST